MGRNRLPGRHRRLQFECFEERQLLATFTESGSTLIVTLDNTNELLAISSTGSSYQFTSIDISDGGITAGRVTGFGGTLATVTPAGLADYDTIQIVDEPGIGGTQVVFNHSQANQYSDNFIITLDDPAAGVIAFNGSSSFSGFNSLRQKRPATLL